MSNKKALSTQKKCGGVDLLWKWLENNSYNTKSGAKKLGVCESMLKKVLYETRKPSELRRIDWETRTNGFIPVKSWGKR